MRTLDGQLQLLDLVRQAGVSEARVLDAMRRVPRDLFVPKHFQNRAFEDVALPIGYHQTVSQPQVVGLMTQALDVGDRMKVLEIGTGSGYQAAILARLCRRLYTVERFRPLLTEAERRFTQLRLHNITALYGDGTLGWPEQAPFDRIMVTAAAIDVPPLLVGQLAVGGVMVLPMGDDKHDQTVVKVVKTETGWEVHDVLPVRFVPLIAGVAEA